MVTWAGPSPETHCSHEDLGPGLWWVPWRSVEIRGPSHTLTPTRGDVPPTLGDYTLGCSFVGGFWALSPIENLAQWLPHAWGPRLGQINGVLCTWDVSWSHSDQTRLLLPCLLGQKVRHGVTGHFPSSLKADASGAPDPREGFGRADSGGPCV